MPADRRTSDEMIDELLAGASTEEEIAWPGGLLTELTKRLVERAMEVELTDHLGYELNRPGLMEALAFVSGPGLVGLAGSVEALLSCL